MKKRANFFDYVFLLRPSIQAALWTFFMAGVYMRFSESIKPALFAFRIEREAALGLLGYSLLMGSVYVLNQISDIDTDRLNNKLFLLSDGIISVKNAYLFASVCSVAGFGIFLTPMLFSVNRIVLVSVSFIMGIMYTVRPFECKRRPFIDLALNSAGYGVAALLLGYSLAGGSVCPAIVLRTLPYALSMGAVFVNTTLMDYDGDRKVGAVTTGVKLGIEKSLALSFSLMLLAAISGWILKDILILFCAVYSLFPFSLALIYRGKKSIEASVKYSSPVMTLALGLLFPQFLVLSLITLASIYLYYSIRFKKKGL